jgi:hypothetical protein
MRSIQDIHLSELTKNKTYWNSERPIEEELMYFLLVDRFHDGKSRNTVLSDTGFGTLEALQTRCGGTIQGITGNLKYISEMGFTSIWINPFLQNNPESYHGYSIENFLEVDSQWGTKADIIELVSKAHDLNLRVFFDIVVNHTGNNWSYIKENPAYKNGIRFAAKVWRYDDRPIPSDLRNFNCYSRKGRIVNWEEIPETWDGDIFELKDLIQDESIIGDENLEVMIAVYSYWFALTDCDGFRIDAAKHIAPVWLNKFISEINKFVKSVNKKDFFVFAEIIGEQSLVNQYTSIDGYLDFNFYLSFVKNMLGDKKRPDVFSAENEKIPIRFLDNHDQIGQMPKHRIAYRMNESAFINLLRAFLLLPGIPCIYYGTEQGLKGRGLLDGAIRECLFNPFGDDDILSKDSPYWKTIREFSKIRRKLGTNTGKFANCQVISSIPSKCIALQISGLSSDKIIFYNLGAHNEQVSIKLSMPISRTNKLVVYLYSDNGSIENEVTIVNSIIQQIEIKPYGFILFDILSN